MRAFIDVTRGALAVHIDDFSLSGTQRLAEWVKRMCVAVGAEYEDWFQGEGFALGSINFQDQVIEVFWQQSTSRMSFDFQTMGQAKAFLLGLEKFLQ